MITFDVLRDELQKEYEICKNWAQIARQYTSPITRAHIYKIVVKGWEPEAAHIRAALGLEPLVHVPACPICGLAHTHAHGEQVYDPTTQVVKPLPRPRKSRPARIAIRKDDMQKAATTIMNNLNRDEVTELVTQLWFRLRLAGFADDPEPWPLDKSNYKEGE